MRRVSAALRRSPTTTPAERGARSATAEARSDDRACRTTRWPSSSSDWAAARPRPSVLPVIKMHAISRFSSLGPDHHFERLALVHRPVAVRHPVEPDGAVEHPAWVDAAFHHVRQQLRDIGARRRRTSGDTHILEEHLIGGRDDLVVRHADPANRAAGPSNRHGRGKSLLGSNAFQHRMDSEAAGQCEDALDSLFAPLAYYVSS